MFMKQTFFYDWHAQIIIVILYDRIIFEDVKNLINVVKCYIVTKTLSRI